MLPAASDKQKLTLTKIVINIEYKTAVRLDARTEKIQNSS